MESMMQQGSENQHMKGGTLPEGNIQKFRKSFCSFSLSTDWTWIQVALQSTIFKVFLYMQYAISGSIYSSSKLWEHYLITHSQMPHIENSTGHQFEKWHKSISLQEHLDAQIPVFHSEKEEKSEPFSFSDIFQSSEVLLFLSQRVT